MKPQRRYVAMLYMIQKKVLMFCLRQKIVIAGKVFNLCRSIN
ncbi:hypothetical protein BC792_11938 [Sphingobacterium allocomposti]|uniref:Uncharacterized protein n=1 Tax=Sphingobacterium allocomposti TaxID=415956 RepID=A0A5S5D7R0_9SPHI|nr:hypothetical protein BC792_11938 [Sphingobacterium composti Yoo et al. 2007 non Ten et al. 2007]